MDDDNGEGLAEESLNEDKVNKLTCSSLSLGMSAMFKTYISCRSESSN